MRRGDFAREDCIYVFYVFFTDCVDTCQNGEEEEKTRSGDIPGQEWGCDPFFLHLWKFGSRCERSAGCAALECALERWKEQG